MTEKNLAIRLSVMDGGKVKAELKDVGDAGQKALQHIEQASQPASKALLAIDAASHNLQGRVQGLAHEMGPLGSALGALGPYGLAAAAGLADADATLTTTEALTAMYLRVTGTLTAARTITVPANSKSLMVENATTGGFAVTIKTPSGAGVTINAGLRKILYCDGTDMILVSEANVNAPYDVGGKRPLQAQSE